MRPAEFEAVPRLSEVVRRAVDVCEGPDDLFIRFEDRDEPITAIEDIEQEVAESTGELDPQREEPVLVIAGAVVTYLGHRRDAIDEPDERLLRLALDAELTDPPETVRDWITDAGLPDPR